MRNTAFYIAFSCACTILISLKLLARILSFVCGENIDLKPYLVEPIFAHRPELELFAQCDRTPALPRSQRVLDVHLNGTLLLVVVRSILVIVLLLFLMVLGGGMFRFTIHGGSILIRFGCGLRLASGDRDAQRHRTVGEQVLHALCRDGRR